MVNIIHEQKRNLIYLLQMEKSWSKIMKGKRPLVE